jgi:hypothetical protein
MKVKFRIFRKGWKSVSIYTKKREIMIRYWGGFQFDLIKLQSTN